MTWEDGSKYEGEWKNGERHGKGTFYYTNGDKYIGDWVRDVQHGKGIYYFQNGERYEGDYADGERTGKGIYVYPNGDKYVGQFKNGWQEGTGTFTWQNGAVYEGQWAKTNGLEKDIINGETAMNTKVNGRITWPKEKAFCACRTDPSIQAISLKARKTVKVRS